MQFLFENNELNILFWDHYAIIMITWIINKEYKNYQLESEETEGKEGKSVKLKKYVLDGDIIRRGITGVDNVCYCGQFHIYQKIKRNKLYFLKERRVKTEVD